MIKKIKRVSMLAVLLSAGVVSAQTIAPGSYMINDGTIIGTIMVTVGNNGKYLFEGGVKNRAGAECMMSGPATLNGSELEIGYKCTVRLKASENQIVIDDYKKCIPCDPGAYISGTYKR